MTIVFIKSVIPDDDDDEEEEEGELQCDESTLVRSSSESSIDHLGKIEKDESKKDESNRTTTSSRALNSGKNSIFSGGGSDTLSQMNIVAPQKNETKEQTEQTEQQVMDENHEIQNM